MTVLCGNCHEYHPSSADVRTCYGQSGKLPQAELPKPLPGIDGVDASMAEALRRQPKPDLNATEAQVGFIRDLYGKRIVPAAAPTPEEAEILARLEDCLEEPMTRFVGQREASQVIDWLKELPLNEPRQNGNGSKFPDIPAGHYAVESRTGNNDLDFFRVDRPEKGKWAGRTFVKRVIGGRPAQAIRGKEQRQALEAIVATGVEQAAVRYGQEIGRCYRCNRHLTDETSRALGIGPECRKVVG